MNIDRNSIDKVDNRRDSIDSFIDSSTESRIVVDSEIDLNRNLNIEINRNNDLDRINLDAEIDVDRNLISNLDNRSLVNVCSLDHDRVGRLPEYLVNFII